MKIDFNYTTQQNEIWYSEEEYKDLIKHIEQQQQCINELEWQCKKLMKELEDKNE